MLLWCCCDVAALLLQKLLMQANVLLLYTFSFFVFLLDFFVCVCYLFSSVMFSAGPYVLLSLYSICFNDKHLCNLGFVMHIPRKLLYHYNFNYFLIS